jgi:hypothetical protein
LPFEQGAVGTKQNSAVLDAHLSQTHALDKIPDTPLEECGYGRGEGREGERQKGMENEREQNRKIVKEWNGWGLGVKEIRRGKRVTTFKPYPGHQKL